MQKKAYVALINIVRGSNIMNIQLVILQVYVIKGDS